MSAPQPLPPDGSTVTCLVDGQKHTGKVVRLSDDRNEVVIEQADDGYTNHVSFPVASIVELHLPEGSY